jgi:hypothetical protein
MNWGRYAEIFDYDRASGRLVQTEAAQTEVTQAETVQTEPAPTRTSEDHNSTPTPKA